MAIEAARYAQAYRLFTLALAQTARDRRDEPAARIAARYSIGERWMLVSAYKLAGKPDVANDAGAERPAAGLRVQQPESVHLRLALRDRAMVLMGLTLLGRDEDSNGLLEQVSAQLSDMNWYSTQSVSFALVAVAQNAGAKPFKGFSFDYSAGKAHSTVKVTANRRWRSITLPAPPHGGHAARS